MVEAPFNYLDFLILHGITGQETMDKLCFDYGLEGPDKYQKLAEAIKSLEDQGKDWNTGAVLISDSSGDVAGVRAQLESKLKVVGNNLPPVEIPLATTPNFLRILKMDSHFQDIRYDTLRNIPVKHTADGYQIWTDADDAEARLYIEDNYQIHNRQKYEDAFLNLQTARQFDPIQEKIEAIEWDKKDHISSFFPTWLKTENTAYTRECARLLFAGGINRAYNPGCKFDIVIVLQGPQGSGKTVMCQHLAMADDFYCSLVTMKGKEGEENTDGKWIVELEELLATVATGKGSAEVEQTAKAFISKRFATYRKPYDRRPQNYFRHCIFIGTTNQLEFLTDSTGNRRWYPVKVNSDGRYLMDHAAELDSEIQQCWAQMLHYFRTGDDRAKPVVSLDLLDAVKAAQSSAETEDPWEAQIAEYVKDTDRVCLREIWENCLYKDYQPKYPERSKVDSNRLSSILVHKLGWTRHDPERCAPYGKVRTYYNPAFPGNEKS